MYDFDVKRKVKRRRHS